MLHICAYLHRVHNVCISGSSGARRHFFLTEEVELRTFHGIVRVKNPIFFVISLCTSSMTSRSSMAQCGNHFSLISIHLMCLLWKCVGFFFFGGLIIFFTKRRFLAGSCKKRWFCWMCECESFDSFQNWTAGQNYFSNYLISQLFGLCRTK